MCNLTTDPFQVSLVAFVDGQVGEAVVFSQLTCVPASPRRVCSFTSMNSHFRTPRVTVVAFAEGTAASLILTQTPLSEN